MQQEVGRLIVNQLMIAKVEEVQIEKQKYVNTYSI